MNNENIINVITEISIKSTCSSKCLVCCVVYLYARYLNTTCYTILLVDPKILKASAELENLDFASV